MEQVNQSSVSRSSSSTGREIEYPPLNHLLRSTHRQREEQKGYASPSRSISRPQIGHVGAPEPFALFPGWSFLPFSDMRETFQSIT